MKKILINGYKSLKHIELELQPINILIGANGAGKSNILSFFEFLDNLYNQKLQHYVGKKGGISKFLFNGETRNKDKRIYAKVVFDHGKNSYSFEIEQAGSSFVFTEESLWYKNDELKIIDVRQEASIKFNSAFRAEYIQHEIKSLKKYHFHETGPNSPFNQASKIGKDSLELYDKGENLAAFIYEIKRSEYKIYHRIIKTIQSVIPHFSDFVLEPDSENNIVLFWQDQYSNYIYDVNDFSDGSIRFIALTILFLQPRPPRTIIIDEPELGLHPFAISKLAGLIQSVASERCQVIIATQSADLITHFEPKDVIAVDIVNGETNINRLDNDLYQGWLEDYTLGDLWKRNIINSAQPNK